MPKQEQELPYAYPVESFIEGLSNWHTDIPEDVISSVGEIAKNKFHPTDTPKQIVQILEESSADMLIAVGNLLGQELFTHYDDSQKRQVLDLALTTRIDHLEEARKRMRANPDDVRDLNSNSRLTHCEDLLWEDQRILSRLRERVEPGHSGERK